MKRYQLEVTEEQLRLIANAVEDWHRLLAGQAELYHATSLLRHPHQAREALREHVRPLIVPELAHSPGASYNWAGSGCPGKHRRKAIALSYGIYREIIHRLTVNDGQYNVYSSPTLTCEDSIPLPKIVPVGEDTQP